MQWRISVVLLTTVLGYAARLTPQERILAMPPGTFIEVRLTDKTKLHGRFDKVEASGFVMTASTANHLDLVERKIAFSELKSARRVRDGRDSGDHLLSNKITALVVLFVVFVLAPIALAIGDH